MRVARAHETLDERRDVIVDLLIFVRDFFRLDTTLLVDRAHNDNKFIEAAEAVLQTAVGPWRAVEAIRDFAVQALHGERPIKGLADRMRGRVSPYSVPYALLKALAPSPGQFQPQNLRSLSVADARDCNGYAGEETRWEVKPHGGEAWLVTTMWARTIPRTTKATTIRVYNVGDGRILHEGKLWGLTADAMPCFWWLPSHTPLEVTLTRQQQEEPSTILLAIEGWRYVRG